MKDKDELISQVEILKSLGHNSRTLLNGITGPIEIIRSLSDDHRLIEPLRILSLGISRFEKYSFRALFLSDLLQEKKEFIFKPFNLDDAFRYSILDLSDLLDFFNMKIVLENDSQHFEIISHFELLFQCIMILLEKIISLCEDGSTINIKISKDDSQVVCSLTFVDGGMVNKSLGKVFVDKGYPSDVDLYLLKLGFDILNVNYQFDITERNKSGIRLELP